MLVEGLLFLAGFLVLLARLVALCQRVERFDATALAEPFLLACLGELPRLSNQFPSLTDGVIESFQERSVVAPLFATETVACSVQETGVILAPILREQFHSIGRLLLAGNQLAKVARRLLQFHLGKIENRLERKILGHEDSYRMVLAE